MNHDIIVLTPPTLAFLEFFKSAKLGGGELKKSLKSWCVCVAKLGKGGWGRILTRWGEHIQS